MVCYRINGNLYALSTTPNNKINTADNYLTQALATDVALNDSSIGDDYYVKQTLADGTIQFGFSLRVLSRSQRDLIRSNILKQIESNINPLYFSYVEIHTCGYNEHPRIPCVDYEFQWWGTKPPDSDIP